MKTTTLLLTAGLMLAFVSLPTASASHCDNARVGVACEGESYTWCSPNDPSTHSGYRSSDGSCPSTHQAQSRYDPGCTLYVARSGCVIG